MKWLEVSCRVPKDASEALGAVILDWPEVQGLAVEGVIDEAPLHPEFGEWLDDSLLETDAVVIRFYLPEPTTAAETLSRLKAALALVAKSGFDIKTATDDIAFQIVDEESWASAWKEDYHAMSVGQRLLVVPEWEMNALSAQEQERIPIFLEPGMAFGTGTHQTTQLCLEALEDVITDGDRVLDVGCGTAILSIAAAKLGAGEVLAMDIDPVAVSTARENVNRNDVAGSVLVMNGNLLEPLDTDQTPVVTESGIVTPLKDAFLSPQVLSEMPAWDVVVANILRDIIIMHLPVIRDCLAPNGKLLVSGFVREQVQKVAAAMETNGFRVRDRHDKDDWVVLVAELAS